MVILVNFTSQQAVSTTCVSTMGDSLQPGEGRQTGHDEMEGVGIAWTAFSLCCVCKHTDLTMSCPDPENTMSDWTESNEIEGGYLAHEPCDK